MRCNTSEAQATSGAMFHQAQVCRLQAGAQPSRATMHDKPTPEQLVLWDQQLVGSSGTAESNMVSVSPVGPLSQGGSSLCITAVPDLSLPGFGCLSL